MKNDKREYIKASGTQGLTKSDISVLVGTPTGKTKQIAYGERLHFTFRKQKKRKPEYTTLLTFGRKGRWKFTHNVINNNISATVSMGHHYDFHVLDMDDLAKLFALTLLKFGHRYIDREVSNKLDDNASGSFSLLVQYYYQQFKKKISKTRRAVKIQLAKKQLKPKRKRYK